jgi:hypothetical protein
LIENSRLLFYCKIRQRSVSVAGLAKLGLYKTFGDCKFGKIVRTQIAPHEECVVSSGIGADEGVSLPFAKQAQCREGCSIIET